MQSGHNESAQAAYRPTSLDFINLPNPIEPYAGSQRHPLNGTPRLEKARLDTNANQDLFRIILENDLEQPAKRQKTADNPHLDLPKLPVRSGPKRPRIPPTLSGLHQPPPDAGLLPSISVDKPPTPPPRLQEVCEPRPAPSAAENTDLPPAPAAGSPKASPASKQPAKTSKKRVKKNKWTDEETEWLLKGVARFGIGSWTSILRCPDYSFPRRTALDLKDRFRVCCPDQYKTSSNPLRAVSEAPVKDGQATPGSKSEAVPSSKLRELGIDEPFVKSERRSRHGYSSAEDEALLNGFIKHGNQWAIIRQEAGSVLAGRKPTDLRDRFRTRFPREFAEAGLASKRTKASAIPRRITKDVSSDTANSSESEAVRERPRNGSPKPVEASVAPVMPPVTSRDDAKIGGSKRLPQPSLFSLDDVFLGAAFGAEDDDAESEPIILDRGILDWASGDNSKTTSSDPSRPSGINPQMTLKLPKPHSSLQTPVPAAQQPAAISNTTSLPSLSTMFPDTTNPEHLELPSLMNWLGPMEADGRNRDNTFPSLEELFG